MAASGDELKVVPSSIWWSESERRRRRTGRGARRARSRTAAAGGRAGSRGPRRRRRRSAAPIPSSEAVTPARLEERREHRCVAQRRVAEHDEGRVGDHGPEQREPDPAVPGREPVHADAAVQPRQPGHQEQLQHHDQGRVQAEELGDREHRVLAGTGGEEQQFHDHQVHRHDGAQHDLGRQRRWRSRADHGRVPAVIGTPAPPPVDIGGFLGWLYGDDRCRVHRNALVDRRGMRVGAATTVRGLAPAVASFSSSSAPAAICPNGTRTVVSGIGSRLTTGMSL